jgi:hypothetical protein
VVVAAMNRLAWVAAALGATAFLAALAFTGGRGGPGLEPFVPKGLMTIPVEDVREVDVTASRGHWHFVRTQAGWRATQGAAAAGFEARLDSALKLLRNSGPDRVLTEAEVARVGVSVSSRPGSASLSADPALRCSPFRSAAPIRWACRTMRGLTEVRRSHCCQPSLSKNGSGREAHRDDQARAMGTSLAAAYRLLRRACARNHHGIIAHRIHWRPDALRALARLA